MSKVLSKIYQKVQKTSRNKKVNWFVFIMSSVQVVFICVYGDNLYGAEHNYLSLFSWLGFVVVFALEILFPDEQKDQ